MSKDRDSVLTQAIKKRFAEPSKGKDNAPWSYQRLTQTILDKNGDYVAMIRGWGHLTGKGHAALGLSEEEAIAIQDDRGRRLAKVPEYEAEIERLKSRQSPQINIDELALVVQIELVDLLPKNTDPLKVIEACNTANLIAQAITSHLNGKGDGDE